MVAPPVCNAFYHIPCFPLLPYCIGHLFRPPTLVSLSRRTFFPRRSTTQLLRHLTNASVYCLHSLSPVPFSASSSYYFLLTLSLYSTITSTLHFHHLKWSLVLFLFFKRTSNTTDLCCVVTYPPANALQSFTLLSCCRRTTSRSSSVLCCPLL